jgi:Cft2 family RNA processing exonuclease
MGPLTFTNLTRAVEIGANSYVLDLAGQRLVLDSGLHPTLDGPLALPDHSLIADDSIDAIVLSHSHQDHIGSLPVLQRRQPNAQVFMTEATRQLGDVMLHNSVNVMTKRREVEGAALPQFGHREIDLIKRQWRCAPLRTRFDLTGERLPIEDDTPVSIGFFDAGHILGSVGTLIRAHGRKIFYTGDVQFDDQTIMQAAGFPDEPLDVLIMETTRGDSPTPDGFTRDAEERRFADAIEHAFANGGSVFIPTFALGKTQEMLALFYEFRRRGWLKGEHPIYIGGLGCKLTEIHDKLAGQTCRQHQNLRLLDAVAPFVLSGEKGSLAAIKPRHIYALSSGMMTEKTLSNSFARQVLSSPPHAILFIGYADPDSPAGKIRAAAPGDLIQLAPDLDPQPLTCPVERFNFSGHASRESLRAYANKVRPKKIILVHGDPAAIEWFRATLQADLPDTEVLTPAPGVTLEL